MYNTLHNGMKTKSQLVFMLNYGYNKMVLLKVVGTLQHYNITIVIISYLLHISIIQCIATVKLLSTSNCCQ